MSLRIGAIGTSFNVYSAGAMRMRGLTDSSAAGAGTATGSGASGTAVASGMAAGAASGVEKNLPQGIVESKADAGECQTCKNRKYVDGSDEMVSYKSPAHISPDAAASAVRAHEGEHVTNAYSKAATNDGKVISADVQIKTAVCPECGRTYVSGGTTTTHIKYSNESNPYQQAAKTQDGTVLRGANFEAKV